MLRWVRRMEIAGALWTLAIVALVWSSAWWNWLLLGIGLFGLSPVSGASAILRKAQTRPEVLVHDPEVRRRRGRRALAAYVPTLAVALAVVGYVQFGLGGAVVFGLVGLAGALGAWVYLKTEAD
ncbi:MAG: hypothetical protein M3345_02100 [Actinomycetota bacterium]|nr:hypothetical protein [Actinomycetota bacterium]